MVLTAFLHATLEGNQGLADLLGGQRGFGQFVGALGTEGIEHEVEVAAPGAGRDRTGCLDDACLGPDDEGEVLRGDVGAEDSLSLGVAEDLAGQFVGALVDLPAE
jgi:hypothetical protein